MKARLALLAGLVLSGANALACYTVYDGNSRIVYQGMDPPVDMSLQLQEALARRFPAGAEMVFDQNALCAPIGLAQAPRPAGGDVPLNTIRMEPAASRPSSSAPSPLFTERDIAQRSRLPHTQVAGDIVVVPPTVADRVMRPSVNVLPSTTFAAAPGAPDTRTMGAGRSRTASSANAAAPAVSSGPTPTRQVVITEFRDPPMTVIERGGGAITINP